MKLLIDGDVVRYRCGFAAQKTRYAVAIDPGDPAEGRDHAKIFENAKDANAYLKENELPISDRSSFQEVEPVENALHSVKLMMQSMQAKWPEAEMKVYFSCRTPDNWRTQLYPQYKANRPARRPEHDAAIHEYMSKKYSCVSSPTLEADDMIAMQAESCRDTDEEFVVCSIDKDLKQIGGVFYDFVKDELTLTTDEESNSLLEHQKITGDSVDNIPGIAGWGPKKAAKWLENPVHTARDAYVSVFQDFDMAWYHYCLNQALVTLPGSVQEQKFLIAEVEDARKEVQAIQEAGGDAVAEPASAGVGEADTSAAKASC